MGWPSCGDGSAPGDPAHAVKQVLRLAADPQRSLDDPLFEVEPLSQSEAQLHLALDAIAEFDDVRIVGIEAGDAPSRSWVDLVGTLRAGGSVSISMLLELQAGDQQRLVWLNGPGFDWPKRRRRRGHGLSSSAPGADR